MAGRPRTIDVEDLIKQFDKFIAETPNPMIEKFLLTYECGKTRFYELEKENEALANSIKKAIMKQEVYLNEIAIEKPGTVGFVNFKLKQPAWGYTDKQEINTTNRNIDSLDNLSKEELEEELRKLGYSKSEQEK